MGALRVPGLVCMIGQQLRKQARTPPAHPSYPMHLPVQLLERMLGLAGPDGTMDKPLDSSDKLEAVKSDELEVD